MYLDLLLLFGIIYFLYDIYKKLILKKVEIIELGPGSVFIKNALNIKQQISLSRYALHVDRIDKNGGFYQDNNKKCLNATRSRGRIYRQLIAYPQFVNIKNLCLGLLNLVHHKRLPKMTPTHLLLLYYASDKGIKWHRDTDPNDGDNDEPIVSISLGNSCVFGYKQIGKHIKYIKINSGDVVIWGGMERNLLHSVENVKLRSAPSEIYKIIGDVRLNFTFRSAPNILGFEDHFSSLQYFVDEP